MIKDEIIIIISYIYAIIIITFRILYNKEIDECTNDNQQNTLHFGKLTIASSFFLTASCFLSITILYNNYFFKYFYYKISIIALSFGTFHLFFFANVKFSVLKCQNNAIIMNALISFPSALVFSSVSLIFVLLFIAIILVSILGIIDYVFKINNQKMQEKLFNIFNFSWCLVSITLLFIYETTLPIKIIVIIQTTILTLLLFIARQVEYNKKVNFVNISIVLGIISFIMESQTKITPITINSLMPSCLIFFYLYFCILQKRNKIDVNERAVDKTDITQPPKIYASGNFETI